MERGRETEGESSGDSDGESRREGMLGEIEETVEEREGGGDPSAISG